MTYFKSSIELIIISNIKLLFRFSLQGKEKMNSKRIARKCGAIDSFSFGKAHF